MTEFTLVTHDPVIEDIVDTFNRMGVRLEVEHDQFGDYLVHPNPTVYFVPRDLSLHKLDMFQGKSSLVKAFTELNEDVLNRCKVGTPYIHGLCHLLVEDSSREDFKEYEIVDRKPVDTGNRMRLVPQ